MDLTEFITAVAHMRELQTLYFKTRSQDILKQCKIAEKNVDVAIEHFMDKKQTDIFSETTP